MNNRELSRFYYDLASLAQAGFSIERALDRMKRGKKGPIMWMMDVIQYKVTRGETLFEAMSKYPKHFDRFQLMIIRGAETSGMLAKTFRKLGQYYEERHKTKMRLSVAMLYPILLLHAMILLPPIKYLIVSSETSYWSAALQPLLISYACLILVYVFWRRFGRGGAFRYWLDGFLLHMPVVGKLLEDMAIARMFWTLGNLLDAGIDAVTAARSAAVTTGNSQIEMSMRNALYLLEGGRTFKEFFAASGVLSTTYLGMVTVGEDTGQMVDSLDLLVRQLDDSNRERTKVLLKFGAVAAYLMVAAFVAYSIFSFYISYFGI